MSTISLYSSDGLAETLPIIEIFIGEALVSKDLRSRLVGADIELNRKKRPKAELRFAFEHQIVHMNTQDDYDFMGPQTSVDAITEVFPLDSKVTLRFGYKGQFKKFGPFDVTEHTILFTDGGVRATVALEGFGIARHASDYRVYSSGTIFEVMREIANRNGITFPDRNLQAAIVTFQESIKSIASQVSAPGVSGGSASLEDIKDLISVEGDDPFVQVGDDDYNVIQQLAAQYGLSPQLMDDGSGLGFVTLFHVSRTAQLSLIYGSTNGNIQSIRFKTKKPRTRLIRARVKPSSLPAEVPTKGKAKERAPAPAPTTAQRQTRQGGTTEGLFGSKGLGAKQEAPVLNTSAAETDETGSTTKDSATKASTSTKENNQNRRLGKVIGRRRRAGSVLGASVSLITGSVIPIPGMTVDLEVFSNFYTGTYVVDKVVHSIETNGGFQTELSLRRPMPVAKPARTGSEESKSEAKEPTTDTSRTTPNTPQTAPSTGGGLFGSSGLGAKPQAPILDTSGKAGR